MMSTLVKCAVAAMLSALTFSLSMFAVGTHRLRMMYCWAEASLARLEAGRMHMLP